MNVEKLVNLVNQARKFLVAFVAALGVLAAAATDGNITTNEWFGVAIAFLGAFGVYQISNKE